MSYAVRNKLLAACSTFFAVLFALSAGTAHADAVTEWNIKAGDVITEAKMGTPPAIRVMAIVQTAVFQAVNGITKRYPEQSPGLAAMKAPDNASVDAAVAAATRGSLLKLIPAQQAGIEAAYQAALTQIPDGAAKTAGVSAGEAAAAAMLMARTDDGAGKQETYRPHAVPGVYVPTPIPAVPQWTGRLPWLMSAPAQFRPGPPPALNSDAWVRNYNELKELGGKVSARRTPEQTEIARFWEYSLPAIYYGVTRSVAGQPGRDVTRNARLYAAISQAMDDGMIAIMDAKYHYNFWRPITAIRNGDTDGNDATERDAAWTAFIDVPLHPEYPSAHSILASSVATVLQAEVGKGPMPLLSTASPTAKGATRSWTSVDEFSREVAEARIYDGVHYRFSTEVGTAMGKQVGALAVAKYLR